MSAATGPLRHTWYDDALAFVTGTLFIAIGVTMFTHAGLLTGGTAGLAFLAHYASGIGFGPLFFAINLPFYALARRAMGRSFTLKTFAAVTLLSALTSAIPRWAGFAVLDPWFAAVAGGLLMGAGFLVLFRHHASLGGLNIAVLVLQKRYGWRAGWVQMGIDGAILVASLAVVEPKRIAMSIVGALALNLTLALNHRPGRYVAF
ncbi:YitT family protein [Piscinibacter aquaticus]|uniref:YitT family protein n=1 Tax=Piscinibacter aquaticus TaxID=392597 RepID=A0A5C6TYH2_9BURK|nr:YitT family protein [Piscinibacter aquaticus]